MNRPKLNCTRGFTLIEIMIVVALIAILSAIAMPAYNNYINRGKLKTAQADLVALSLNLENYYQKRLAYPDTALADTGAVKDDFTGWSPAADDDDFNYSTATGSGSDPAESAYSVIATGTSGGVLNCVLTLNNKGEKTLTNCPYGGGEWL